MVQQYQNSEIQGWIPYISTRFETENQNPIFTFFFCLLVSWGLLVHNWILRLGRTTVTRLSTQATAESFHCSKPSDFLGEGKRAGALRGAGVTVVAWSCTPHWVWHNVPLPLVMNSRAGMGNDSFVSPASDKNWVLSLSVSPVLLLTYLSWLVLNIYFQDFQ